MFSPPLRGGENPGAEPEPLTPPLRSGENQGLETDP